MLLEVFRNIWKEGNFVIIPARFIILGIYVISLNSRCFFLFSSFAFPSSLCLAENQHGLEWALEGEAVVSRATYFLSLARSTFSLEDSRDVLEKMSQPQ